VKRLAAVDIGTNSVRLLVADADKLVGAVGEVVSASVVALATFE